MSPFKCLSIFFCSLSSRKAQTHHLSFSLPHPSINAVLLSLAFSPGFINVGGFLWEQRGALKGLHAGLRESSPIQCLQTKGGSRLFFFLSSFFPPKEPEHRSHAVSLGKLTECKLICIGGQKQLCGGATGR